MLTLSAKIREDFGKKVKNLRKEGIIPAVLYGPKIKNINLEIDLKEFENIYNQAGESSLIKLKIKKQISQEKEKDKADKSGKEFLVLVHVIEINPLSQKPIHVDFYQPKLDEEITVSVSLVFEGEPEAVKNLGGTLVKNIHEVEVKALPESLPHEIKVDISGLKTFENDILIKDLILPEGTKIMKDPQETVAFVAEPEKVEEELEKPVEEKVEEVEKVEEKEEGEKEEEEEKKEA